MYVVNSAADSRTAEAESVGSVTEAAEAFAGEVVGFHVLTVEVNAELLCGEVNGYHNVLPFVELERGFYIQRLAEAETVRIGDTEAAESEQAGAGGSKSYKTVGVGVVHTAVFDHEVIVVFEFGGTDPAAECNRTGREISL